MSDVENALAEAREALASDGKIVGIMEAEEIMIRRGAALRKLVAAIDAQQPMFYAHAGFLSDLGEKNSGSILVTRQPTPNSVALYRGLK